MFIKNNSIFLGVMYICVTSLLYASEESVLQQTNIQKSDSWVSIASDASWKDTKNDFPISLSVVEQIRILAAKNNFLDDDESDNDDEESSDHESESSDGAESDDSQDESENETNFVVGRNQITMRLVTIEKDK